MRKEFNIEEFKILNQIITGYSVLCADFQGLLSCTCHTSQFPNPVASRACSQQLKTKENKGQKGGKALAHCTYNKIAALLLFSCLPIYSYSIQKPVLVTCFHLVYPG